MSLMGGALILISSGDHESNNNNDKYQQTFYAAEMALLEGERYLLNEKSGPWDEKTNARDETKKELPDNPEKIAANKYLDFNLFPFSRLNSENKNNSSKNNLSCKY